MAMEHWKRKLSLHKKVWKKFALWVQSHFVLCINPGKSINKTNTHSVNAVHAQPVDLPPDPHHDHHQETHRGLVYHDSTISKICNNRRIRLAAVVAETRENDDDDDKEISYGNNNSNVPAEGEGWTCSDEMQMDLEGVDARAEEFIDNFRRHLRIQRAQSDEKANLEWYKMLARSV